MAKLKILLSITVMFLVLEGTASAEEPVQPSPAEIRAASQSILNQTQDTDGVWKIADDGQLRHIQSGITCLPIGTISQFSHLYAGGTPHGDDVGCTWNLQADAGRLSIFVTRHRGQDLKEEISQVLSTIASLYNAELDGAPISMRPQSGGLPAALAARMKFTDRQEQEMKSSVWIHVIDGWILKVRATYPAEAQGAQLAEVLGALQWLAKAHEIQGATTN
jgi:hypothetical protein